MISRHAPRQTPHAPREQLTVPFQDAVVRKLNARVVEFIVKPRKTDELRGLLCKAVTPLLRDRTGFIRTIVLTKHEERRRVLVITFWEAQEQAVSDPWEEIPLVRELLSPLIDGWSSNRSYEVDLTETTKSHNQAISLPVC